MEKKKHTGRERSITNCTSLLSHNHGARFAWELPRARNTGAQTRFAECVSASLVVLVHLDSRSNDGGVRVAHARDAVMRAVVVVVFLSGLLRLVLFPCDMSLCLESSMFVE
jgi:hypothetical protein